MGGTAPANQLRLSFTGSEDGEAETETCRAAKPLWRTTNRTSGPRGLNLLNRRMRTRMYGGVAGESGRPLPLCRLCQARRAGFVLRGEPEKSFGMTQFVRAEVTESVMSSNLSVKAECSALPAY